MEKVDFVITEYGNEITDFETFGKAFSLVGRQQGHQMNQAKTIIHTTHYVPEMFHFYETLDAPLIASNDPIETARLSKIPVYALPSTTNQQFDQILKAILENSKDKKKTKIFPFDDFDSNEFKSFMFNPDRFGYKCNKLQFDENCMQCYL